MGPNLSGLSSCSLVGTDFKDSGGWLENSTLSKGTSVMAVCTFIGGGKQPIDTERGNAMRSSISDSVPSAAVGTKRDLIGAHGKPYTKIAKFINSGVIGQMTTP